MTDPVDEYEIERQKAIREGKLDEFENEWEQYQKPFIERALDGEHEAVREYNEGVHNYNDWVIGLTIISGIISLIVWFLI
jgi:hypothetical protein